jgi:hypothetical protein
VRIRILNVLVVVLAMIFIVSCAPPPVATPAPAANPPVPPTALAPAQPTAVPAAPTAAPSPTKAPPTAEPTKLPSTTAPATFTDPVAYCQAIGNIDAPDARFTGPKVPEMVAAGLQKALGLPGTPAPPVAQNSVWRCMDGKVYACTIGANLPCSEKAVVDRTPAQPVKEYCQANKNSDFVPAVVTGRATIYEWRCTEGVPAIVKELTKVDARGFQADIWYQLGAATSSSTPAASGATAFTDPAAYCKAVGTIDAPDARFTGPKVPEAIASGLQKVLKLTGTPAPPIAQNSVWRCMDGKVYACTIGANLPCNEKAVVDRTPAQPIKEYCQANKNSDFVPAVVTGRATIFEWRCTNGVPAIAKELTKVDARGFQADIWYELPAAVAAATPGASGAATFSDPAAYCKAVGTIDAPDARYSGAKVPALIVTGLQKALKLTGTPTPALTQSSLWRCMDSKVYACTVGANLPCADKANVDRTPTQPMKDFCKANPASDVIPAVVTGRDTIFDWRCTGGAPVISKQLTQVDARGYQTDIWYEIKP